MLKGIDVVFFYSRNMKELAAWYEEMFGINFSTDGSDSDWAELNFASGSKSTRLAIHSWHQGVEQEFMVSFLVDDIQEVVSTLQEKGADVIGDPIINEIEESKYATVRDPEGNLIQLSQRK